eukprot:jgi/Bigna1/73924/fgenesh1_pg.26_\
MISLLWIVALSQLALAQHGPYRCYLDLTKATVLPSGGEISTDPSGGEELGELARLVAKQPASADEGGVAEEVGGLSSEMSSMTEVQFIKSSPQAMKMLKDIKMLAKLIKKAKLISAAIPAREKKLESLKGKLKTFVAAALKSKQEKLMQSFSGKEQEIDSRIKFVQRKLEQLNGAKAKLSNVKSQVGKKDDKDGKKAGTIDDLLNQELGGDSEE